MMTQVNPLWRNIRIYIWQCRRRHILNDLLYKSLTEHRQLVFLSFLQRSWNTPVCIRTNVVDQGAALQHGLHLSQGHVLSRLQLHQVFLTIWKHGKPCCLKSCAGERSHKRPVPASFLTNYLQAAILLDLADVSRAEPPLSILILEEIFLLPGLAPVIPHSDVGSANQDLSSRMWLVSAAVPTCKQDLDSLNHLCAQKTVSSLFEDTFLTHPPPSLSAGSHSTPVVLPLCQCCNPSLSHTPNQEAHRGMFIITIATQTCLKTPPERNAWHHWTRTYRIISRASSLLTFADGSGSAGLRQAVPLTHRAAETHVHKALRGGRQRSSTWQQDARATTQQGANLPEHQPGWMEGRQRRERQGVFQPSRLHVTEVAHTLVAQRRAVSFGELLQLVVVRQQEECFLEPVHLLHFVHHILIDAIHYFLEGEQRSNKRHQDLISTCHCWIRSHASCILFAIGVILSNLEAVWPQFPVPYFLFPVPHTWSSTGQLTWDISVPEYSV